MLLIISRNGFGELRGSELELEGWSLILHGVVLQCGNEVARRQRILLSGVGWRVQVVGFLLP